MSSYKKTYDELLEELLDLSSEYLVDFTTYRNEDPLVILHKLIVVLSMSSNKYSNKYLQSKFIQPPNIMDTRSRYLLLQTFDLLPNKVIPATIDVIFEYTGDVIDKQIEIPEGTEFLLTDEETDNEVAFTTINDYYIKPYNTYVNIKLIEGEYVEENFNILNISNNKIELESESVAIDYVKLYVDGTEYTKIDHAEYSSDINVFSVQYDINHHYNIVFSEETVANIAETSDIVVNYIQSTGTNDFDPYSNTITISSDITIGDEDEDEDEGDDDTNVAEQIVVSTIVGYEIGDTNHTELNNYTKLSTLLSTFRQAITTEDYSSLLNYYPGVAISAAYDISSESANIPELNIMTPFLTKIVIAPTSGYYMTDQLREDIMKYLRTVGLCNEELAIVLRDPDYVEISIKLGVVTTTNNQSELLDIYSTITNTINEYFKVGNIEFGSSISKDYISSIVSKSDSRIEYVDVLEFSDGDSEFFLTYNLNAVQLPLLDNLEILFDYNNISLSDNIYFGSEMAAVEIIYFLQGDRGDFVRMIDNDPALIEQDLDDSITYSEEKYFGYYDQFTLSLDQSNIFNTQDIFGGHGYSMFSITDTASGYHLNSKSDSPTSRDDELRVIDGTFMTDRASAYDNTYDY